MILGVARQLMRARDTAIKMNEACITAKAQRHSSSTDIRTPNIGAIFISVTGDMRNQR